MVLPPLLNVTLLNLLILMNPLLPLPLLLHLMLMVLPPLLNVTLLNLLILMNPLLPPRIFDMELTIVKGTTDKAATKVIVLNFMVIFSGKWKETIDDELYVSV